MPDERILKLRRELAAAISKALGPNAQEILAPKFNIPQPRMSELERGVVQRCSLEWLILRIYGLGGTVKLDLDVPDALRVYRVAQMKRIRERRAERERALRAEREGRAERDGRDGGT